MSAKPRDWRNQLKAGLARSGVPPNLRTLYLAIADYWNPEYGYAWPSEARLAADTGWDPRSVRRILARLEQHRCGGQPIIRVERGGGRRRTNRYYLPVFAPLDRRCRKRGPRVLRSGI